MLVFLFTISTVEEKGEEGSLKCRLEQEEGGKHQSANQCFDRGTCLPVIISHGR